MQQYKWNTIKIQLLQLIINALYESNLMVISDFFISVEIKLAVVERFGSWGLALAAVAVVERWLLEEVRLYSQKIHTLESFFFLLSPEKLAQDRKMIKFLYLIPALRHSR